LINDRSFVYLDPPYRPINKTSSFTAYAKSGFNDQNQIELSNYYKYLSENCGAKVMLSNSNPHNIDKTDNFFHELYSEYNIHEVFASRMVNSDAKKRGKITELLITNY
jgi:DNA adenine methylase